MSTERGALKRKAQLNSKSSATPRARPTALFGACNPLSAAGGHHQKVQPGAVESAGQGHAAFRLEPARRLRHLGQERLRGNGPPGSQDLQADVLTSMDSVLRTTMTQLRRHSLHWSGTCHAPRSVLGTRACCPRTCPTWSNLLPLLASLNLSITALVQVNVDSEFNEGLPRIV
ncbi:hypothetical protein KFL_003020060 [Klebsormidium nitens]|uniref:Uncharacterized protein n=1 Tax=Klebsormidium nitens TaxID=105231 RepID=A0A0U9HKD9_KLENI|nr:hypothetical protein KFL_003020060 [Klebsormidium nitens]|eukprot:GAQ86646.1 hypothetical protein KFL_003020060 [Klebsormidium nitens]